LTLCHANILKSSEVHLDATMHLIYESIVRLEAEMQRMQDVYNVKIRQLSRECFPFAIFPWPFPIPMKKLG
jgi:microcystin degradation protein MlrC